MLHQLRQANTERLPLLRNGRGDLAHSDWSLNDWCLATLGELGELANLLKKVRRGDFTLEDARSDIADELADVLIYLDILAAQAGVDLERAVAFKFNQTSRKVGAPVFLTVGPA